MRASGMTGGQLGVATLMAGVLLGGFDVVLGDVLAPAGTQAAHNFRSATRDSEPAGLATRPLWLRDGQSVVHIGTRSEEHTSELQSLMRISYAVFCLKTKKQISEHHTLI